LAIHASRKRLIGVQRELARKEQNAGGFDLLSLDPTPEKLASLDVKTRIRKLDECNEERFAVMVELSGFAFLASPDFNGEPKRAAKLTTNGKLLHAEPVAKHWSDWIDYWAVDFAYESAGAGVFASHWQSYRTRRDRSLDLKSEDVSLSPGWHKIAVKAIDVYGNETLSVIEIDLLAQPPIHEPHARPIIGGEG
jgi:hypothetical protein